MGWSIIQNFEVGEIVSRDTVSMPPHRALVDAFVGVYGWSVRIAQMFWPIWSIYIYIHDICAWVVFKGENVRIGASSYTHHHDIMHPFSNYASFEFATNAPRPRWSLGTSPHSNSQHQDHSIFSMENLMEFQPKPSFLTGILGSVPHVSGSKKQHKNPRSDEAWAGWLGATLRSKVPIGRIRKSTKNKWTIQSRPATRILWENWTYGDNITFFWYQLKGHKLSWCEEILGYNLMIFGWLRNWSPLIALGV